MSKVILIVEDQLSIRELIRMTLELENYVVHEAEDGAEALTKARALRPALILLDVMMPGGLSGLQVCEAIRKDPQLKRTKVVMLSALGQTKDKQAGLKAGADDYLVKPFSPIDLLNLVERLA